MNIKNLFEKLRKHRKVFPVLVILLIGIACVYSIYNYNREKFISPLQTMVYNPGQLISGSDSSLRIISLERKTLNPVEGASVTIALKNRKTNRKERLFQGKTNGNGSPNIRFKVPEGFEGDCEFMVNVRSPIGHDEVLIPVTVRKGVKIFLTSDKAVYRPGNTMHIRGLVFENSNAVNQQKVNIQVYEPGGNRVFNKELETCNYGIADADFTLGDRINTGIYTIKAIVGNYWQEKKIRVSDNAPPQFNVACTTDKAWYVPGQNLKGKVKAAYFVGKPVARGNVRAALYKSQKDKFEKLAEFNGLTNSRGMFNFEHQLPNNKKNPINKKSSDLLYRLNVEITVQDPSFQLEKITHSIPIARDNLIIQLVPESGKPKPGLENTIYIATTYPDGTPTSSQLEIETWIDGNPKNTKNNQTIQTNHWGIGELKLNIPPRQQHDLFHLKARANHGNTGEKVWHCSLDENQQESILLRTGKSIYQVGETIGLIVLSTQRQGYVYLDLLKDNQVILTKNFELVNGKSQLKLRINDNMAGTLTCCARTTVKKTKPGSPVLWDIQKIIVQPDRDNQIDLAIQPDKKKYYPGQEASINVFARQKGKGCPAALGINILDESNPSMNPTGIGHENFYYNIDRRLLAPNVRQAGFTFPHLLWQENKNISLTPRDKQQISTVMLASQLPAFYRTGEFIGVNSTQQNLKNTLLKKKQFQVFQAYLLTIIVILAAVILFYSIKKKETYLFWAILLFILYMITFQGVMDFFSGYPGAGKSGTLPLLPLISSILIPLVFGVYGIRLLRSRNKRTVLLTFLVIAVCVLPLFLGIVYYKPFKGAVGESLQVSLLPKISHKEKDSRKKSQPVESGTYDLVLAHQFSPETLYSQPRVITDAQGKASFKVKIPDIESVSQWQVSALAHTFKGKMGAGKASLPVSRDLFVKMEVPTNLIHKDEISIPVSIYNYHHFQETVVLKLQRGNWFELSGPASRTVTVRPEDSKVEFFKIRAKAVGNHRMILKALRLNQVPGKDEGSMLSEKVTVIPVGKEIQKAFNHTLGGNREIRQMIPIPETAIRNSDRLLVRIYPGYFSQVVEGMESMLRMPHGCFEQTTSVLYPDVMALDYLKKTEQSTPEIEEKAKSYIASGYQNLLRYETTPGGFSFYGGAPQKIPTAFGLQLFSDMANVYSFDKGLIPRIQKWLLSRMTDDHWEPDGHFGATSSARNNHFAATAYVTWALLHSGLDKNNKQIKRAVAYLERNHESYLDNPNALSYCVLSLVKAGKEPGSILQRLNKLARKDNYGMYWTPGPQIRGGRILSTGATETTAIAALANLEANNRSIDISSILQYLLKNKNAYGIWGSTQATVLTLKVLKEVAPKVSGSVFGNVNIWMNNKHVKKILFTGEDNNDTQEVDLKENLQEFIGGGNPEVRVKFDGDGELFCQILLSYYLRWDDPTIGYSMKKSPIKLDLTCDQKELRRSEILTAEAAASYNGEGVIRFAIIDLGIPPGFKLKTGDFNKIMSKGIIERYEINSGRLLLYVNNLDKKERRFQYRLKAISPCRVRMPEARVYDYYDPEVIHAVQPFMLTVSE